MFGKFIQHFEKELEAIEDQTLEKESQQLTTIYQVSNQKLIAIEHCLKLSDSIHLNSCLVEKEKRRE